ncbi:NAD(P)/FAD-dependent oxidoreductase [Oceanicola sp. S124]|uniref:NAD(P)/FAD-dependent oxidoreductase n=1 Tax=Oceanicola sp. S124 TaxID=1042378 RepID=UPI000494BB8C|nr:FAD-binding oxidoreductase [Oceanicola sp. S124]
MDILTINDRPGVYPDSYYAATASAPAPFPEAEGEIRADVCVVGGGFTGLSAALHLRRSGFDVVLLEASRLGFGASGRNGGQVGTGQRVAQPELEQMVGLETARSLWQIGLESVDLVRQLVGQSGEDCQITPGILHADHRARFVPETRAWVDHMQQTYAYDHIRFLDRDEIRAEVGSPGYHAGALDLGGFHLHPLRYVFALAKLARDEGVRIHEMSRMVDFTPGDPVRIRTDRAVVTADHLVLGLNGYHNNLAPQLARRVMPINNFIAVTEPLGEARARSLIANDYAVGDSRFVINYYRLSRDHRMIFGGGESYGYRFPSDLAAKVRGPMLEVFPQLKDARIDHAWGGTLGITMSRLPHVERLAGNVLSASGFSGHGVAMGSLAGKLMAEAVAGQAGRFDLMAKLPTGPFPGGPLLRSPLLVAAMLWYALRDRL